MACADNNRHAPRTVLPAVNLRNLVFPSKSEGCTLRLSTDNSSAEDPPSSHQKDGNKEWHGTSISNMYFSQGKKDSEQQPTP